MSMCCSCKTGALKGRLHLKGHGLCCLRAAELMRLADQHVQVVDDSFELLWNAISDQVTRKRRLLTYPRPDQGHLWKPWR